MTGTSSHDFTDPTHPDAIDLWALYLPLYRHLLATKFELEAFHPKQARLVHRMADAICQQMIAAELGLLDGTPEQRTARNLELREAA